MPKNFLRYFIILNLAALPVVFLAGQKITVMRQATEEKALPVYGALRSFSLTDSEGIEFNQDSLKGKVWLANFMFTTCPNACPTMNLKISLLQDSLAQEIRFVSFSVDPQKDTSSVLKGYAKKFNAKPGVWFFLTGEKSVIAQLLEDCHFAKAEDPLMHGLKLVLLDEKGSVRGYYDYSDENIVKKLARDIKLLKEKG